MKIKKMYAVTAALALLITTLAGPLSFGGFAFPVYANNIESEEVLVETEIENMPQEMPQNGLKEEYEGKTTNVLVDGLTEAKLSLSEASELVNLATENFLDVIFSENVSVSQNDEEFLGIAEISVDNLELDNASLILLDENGELAEYEYEYNENVATFLIKLPASFAFCVPSVSKVPVLDDLGYRVGYYEEANEKLYLLDQPNDFPVLDTFKVSHLVIGENCKYIGAWFADNADIKDIEGEENVEFIDSLAFANATNLSGDLNLELCIEIGDQSFTSTNISSVSAPVATVIGDECFAKCESLETVSAPLIEVVSNGCFSECLNLKKVELESVKEIGDGAFYQNKAFPGFVLDNCTFIGESAFYGCESLKAASLALCEEISDNAFYDCKKMTAVRIGENLEYIGNDAFGYCDSLVSILLLSEDVELSDSIFYVDKPLSKIITNVRVPETSVFKLYDWDADNRIAAINMVDLIDEDGNIIGLYSYEENEVFVTANDTSKIDSTKPVWNDMTSRELCEGCAKITVLGKAIPKEMFANATLLTAGSVVIQNEECLDIGDGAFKNSSICAEDVSEFKCRSIGASAFEGCKNLVGELYVYTNSLGESAFSDCDNVELVYLISGTCEDVKESGTWAFASCDNLKEFYYCDTCDDITKALVVPNDGSYEMFGSNASNNATVLDYIGIDCNGAAPAGMFSNTLVSKVSFSDRINAVNPRTFKNCDLLNEVNLSNCTMIGASAFENCSLLETVNLDLVTNIENHAFAKVPLKEIVLPNASTIGAFAFEGNIASVITIESSSVTVGSDAFVSRDNTKAKITFPNVKEIALHTSDTSLLPKEDAIVLSPSSISKEATLEISAPLVEVITNDSNIPMKFFNSDMFDIPNLKIAGVGAFYDLRISTIPGTLEEAGAYSFYNCANLSIIPATLKTIGDHAFEKTGVAQTEGFEKEVVLDNVISIGESAFNDVEIETLVIGENVESMLPGAFLGAKINVVKFKQKEVSAPGAFSGSTVKKVEALDATSFGEGLFEGSKELSVVEAPKLEDVGSRCFAGCSLNAIELPNVLNIGDFAFEKNPITCTVELPNIENIGDLAFSECNIITLNLGKNLKHVGASAFALNKNLEKLSCEALEVELPKAGSESGAFYIDEMLPLSIDVLPESTLAKYDYEADNRDITGRFKISIPVKVANPTFDIAVSGTINNGDKLDISIADGLIFKEKKSGKTITVKSPEGFEFSDSEVRSSAKKSVAVDVSELTAGTWVCYIPISVDVVSD